jgi:hypothetical protein
MKESIFGVLIYYWALSSHEDIFKFQSCQLMRIYAVVASKEGQVSS